jgi:glycerophosphoryl diester phosphodiesterase
MTIKRPIIIAHRGASGYRPEHTLASYELAINLGADYIEPDLVSTQDGVLVARHENEISSTTDASQRPEFASRRTTKIIDGIPITGWFTEDFTLTELKTLKAKERLSHLRPQNTTFDNLFEIPTLQEIINLVQQKTQATGRIMGIYPEIKHPSYFNQLGFSIETKLVEILEKNEYRKSNAPVFIQSFEVENLKKLAKITDLPLIQLLNNQGQPYDFILSREARTYRDLAMPAGLAEIATYARGIGVNKDLLLPRDESNKLLSPTTLIDDARAQNLLVHAWTFRHENAFLSAEFQNNPEGEYHQFYRLGIDGVFSDFPDEAVKAFLSFSEIANNCHTDTYSV